MTLEEKVDLLIEKQEETNHNVMVLDKRLFGDKEDEKKIGFIADTGYRFTDIYTRVTSLEKKNGFVGKVLWQVCFGMLGGIVVAVTVFWITHKLMAA